jgi:ankyrin repeat protein
LAQGADINAADQGGIGALHAAAAMGKAEIVRLLIESGADKQQITVSGLTASRVAEAAGHAEIVEYLNGDSIL